MRQQAGNPFLGNSIYFHKTLEGAQRTNPTKAKIGVHVLIYSEWILWLFETRVERVKEKNGLVCKWIHYRNSERGTRCLLKVMKLPLLCTMVVFYSVRLI